MHLSQSKSLIAILLLWVEDLDAIFFLNCSDRKERSRTTCCGQLATAKLPLSIYCHQIITGQLHTVNSPQG